MFYEWKKHILIIFNKVYYTFTFKSVQDFSKFLKTKGLGNAAKLIFKKQY